MNLFLIEQKQVIDRRKTPDVDRIKTSFQSNKSQLSIEQQPVINRITTG